MGGTPSYMSPEHAGCDGVDHRSDLWSLGVIAFECMIGRRPFAGRALGELLIQIFVTPIPRPSLLSAVPDGFDEWFARAAERDVDRRFQSAREMSDALLDVARVERLARGVSPAGSHRQKGNALHATEVCRALLCAAIDEPARLRQRVGTEYRT